MPSCEGQFSFTVPLSTQMYKWEPVIIILGRRAITYLSSSRYETLGLVTTHHFTCSKHTGRPEDYRFLLWKSELCRHCMYIAWKSGTVIGHVRYINIQAWLRGFRVKIANFSSFFCPPIPKRDLDTKKTTPNIEV